MNEPVVLRWNWLQEVAKSDLPSTTKLVLHTLALHMDRAGQNCYPGLTTIAREASLARTSVRDHLRDAETSGWIRRDREQRDNGSWGRTTYLPTIPTYHVGQEPPHVSGHVGQEPPYPPERGGDVGRLLTPLGQELTQGRAPADPPRRAPADPETVKTFRETSRETLSEGEADASALNSEARGEGAVEGEETSTSDSMATHELVGAWINRLPERPPSSAIAKQGAAAKRLVAAHDRGALERALDGMTRLWPHSNGEPFDLFDLERKFAKATVAPARNGTRRGLPTEVDPDDLNAWRNP